MRLTLTLHLLSFPSCPHIHCDYHYRYRYRCNVVPLTFNPTLRYATLRYATLRYAMPHTKFDAVLRARNAAYGLRDLAREVVPLAWSCGFRLRRRREMPSGNVSMAFFVCLWMVERRWEGARRGGEG